MHVNIQIHKELFVTLVYDLSNHLSCKNFDIHNNKITLGPYCTMCFPCKFIITSCVPLSQHRITPNIFYTSARFK